MYELFTSMDSTFLVEDVLRDDKNWTLCEPTLRFVLEVLDKEHRDSGTAWYTSTKDLLTNSVEHDFRRVSTARSLSLLDL